MSITRTALFRRDAPVDKLPIPEEHDPQGSQSLHAEPLTGKFLTAEGATPDEKDSIGTGGSVQEVV
jgi:hypothetical protein